MRESYEPLLLKYQVGVAMAMMTGVRYVVSHCNCSVPAPRTGARGCAPSPHTQTQTLFRPCVRRLT